MNVWRKINSSSKVSPILLLTPPLSASLKPVLVGVSVVEVSPVAVSACSLIRREKFLSREFLDSAVLGRTEGRGGAGAASSLGLPSLQFNNDQSIN